jgi:hypothetical protein
MRRPAVQSISSTVGGEKLRLHRPITKGKVHEDGERINVKSGDGIEPG